MGKRIPIKYVQPVESVYIKLQSGERLHWFDNKLVDEKYKDHEFNLGVY